ncbi:hypothetical protein DPMN_014824 [Dreissena polymorpha]|uniref:Uncharacterized protein n=1 Tax=Dreissena polymorpha TaxID=45954 RepID=A0A9D4N9Z8_DREPO|nr:hypothetical protein DPMN_014824 [Dreissena polymorpha]
MSHFGPCLSIICHHKPESMPTLQQLTSFLATRPPLQLRLRQLQPLALQPMLRPLQQHRQCRISLSMCFVSMCIPSRATRTSVLSVDPMAYSTLMSATSVRHTVPSQACTRCQTCPAAAIHLETLNIKKRHKIK